MGRARPPSIVMVLALIGVLLTCTAAAAPTPSSTSDRYAALRSWRPPAGTGSWVVAGTLVMTAKELAGCAEGYDLVLSEPRGRRASLQVARCADHAAAIRHQNAVFADPVRFPDAFAAVLGLGREIDTGLGDGALRQWVQGDLALAIAMRGCGSTDAACVRDSGRWALDAARGAAVDTADEPPERQTGTLRGWRPPDGSATWRRLRSRTDGDWYCAGGATTTWLASDDRELTVSSVDCPTSLDAKRASQESWQDLHLTSQTGESEALGGTTRVAFDTRHPGLTVIHQTWVAGRAFTRLQLACASGTAKRCAEGLPVLDASMASVAGTTPTDDEASGPYAAYPGLIPLAVGVPLGAFLLVSLLPDLLLLRREVGWDSAPGPAFTSVDDEVRRARIGRTIRRAVVFAAALGLWMLVNRLAPPLPGAELRVLVHIVSPIVLALVAGLVVRRAVPPPPMLRAVRFGGGRRTRLVVATVLRGAALVIGASGLAFYLLTCAGFSAAFQLSRETLRQELELGPQDPFWFAYLSQALSDVLLVDVGLPPLGAALLLFLGVLLVPVTAALVLDRLGRRLQRRDLWQTLAADRRPYFLYLRGFEEDRVRMREVAGRAGLLEVLTPFVRPRFEELMVERLGRFGPTIAIAPGSRRLADLGAAKASFDDDEWQEHIAEWIDGARAVVLAATPSQVRDGLRWELARIAAQHERLRLVVVLAPWPRRALLLHWRGWLAAAQPMQPFDGIDEHGFPEGLQVLTWSAASGWRGYGARRRWDWTYSASIDRAIAELEGAAARPLATTAHG